MNVVWGIRWDREDDRRQRLLLAAALLAALGGGEAVGLGAHDHRVHGDLRGPA